MSPTCPSCGRATTRTRTRATRGSRRLSLRPIIITNHLVVWAHGGRLAWARRHFGPAPPYANGGGIRRHRHRHQRMLRLQPRYSRPSGCHQPLQGSLSSSSHSQPPSDRIHAPGLRLIHLVCIINSDDSGLPPPQLSTIATGECR
jgi:hypothetical protein